MCAASSKILLSRSQRGPSVKETIPRGGGPGPGPQIGLDAKERRKPGAFQAPGSELS